MTTLALDLGQFIGWMKGRAVGPVEHGTFELERTTDLGAWLASTDNFLPTILRGVDHVVIEQPFLGENLYPALKLISLLGHVRWHGRYLGIGQSQVSLVAISSGKATLSGNGAAKADQMIAAACEWYGFEPDEITEHEAIAGGLLKYHYYGPKPAAPKKPRTSKGVSLLKP